MDYQATTPMDPRVFEAMQPYFFEKFGNPHSRTHKFGWEAEEAIEDARIAISKVINADPTEIIFTSGATEANNLALKGVMHFYKDQGKNHLITAITEHKCILESCRALEQEGFKITYLPVDSDGLISLDDLKAAITPTTGLVSIMAMNNEIGVIQPLQAIGEICRANKIFFHTDAAQAFGKIPLNVKDMSIDLMSISGHKIYGPKGVGALYVGKKPRVRLKSLLSGGGQERGMRSGTLPTPLIVGLAEAAKIAHAEMQADYDWIQKLGNKFLQTMLDIPEVYLNGSKNQRYPGCINLSFAHVEGESLIGGLENIAVSSGSACTSSSLEPSYVIRALGKDEDLAHTSIRFGIGRFTKEEEIASVIQQLKTTVERLRDMSPLWEMFQQGIDLKSIQWNTH